MAGDAVIGPRQGLQALGRDRLAARLAQPEFAGLDPPQRALDQAEMLLLALAQLLASLAFGDFGCRRGLGAGRSGRLDGGEAPVTSQPFSRQA